MVFKAGFPISILVVGGALTPFGGVHGVVDGKKQPSTSGGNSLYQLMSTYQHLK